MRYRYVRTILAVLALLAGFAHATLHGAVAQDAHFSSAAGADCPLSALGNCSTALVELSMPGWRAAPEIAVAPGLCLLPRATPPWQSRAPPVVG